MVNKGWFNELEVEDIVTGSIAIQEGSCNSPQPWPGMAIDSGHFITIDDYYSNLNLSSIKAAQNAAFDVTRSPDKQLSHIVRIVDDLHRIENELSSRLSDWIGDYTGVTQDMPEAINNISKDHPENTFYPYLISLHDQLLSISKEREKFIQLLELEMPSVAPNLTQMAGPILAARLISLAGGLEKLAKKPSGTVQVIGAENALFAHLRGHATSPKHGVIYTHEYISKTEKSLRGAASRTFSGKLAIAARIDYYSGRIYPTLHSELSEKIDRIRARGRK
jgi:nucleolar protein 56